MDLDLLSALNAERRARRAAVLVTDLDAGAVRLVRESDLAPDDPLADILAERFRSGRSGLVERGGRRLFLGVEAPPPRLVAIGAVHISQALAPMARLAGFDVAIVDPRTAFATEDRFPGVPLIAEWPESVIPDPIALDAHTALAALTHDPKIDDWPIAAALRAGAFYVGALGSKKTHARRVERLRALGLDEAAIGRVAAPIGLDIGAQSPAEIAVAVLAEIIAALRKRAVGQAGRPLAEAAQ